MNNTKMIIRPEVINSAFHILEDMLCKLHDEKAMNNAELDTLASMINTKVVMILSAGYAKCQITKPCQYCENEKMPKQPEQEHRVGGCYT